MLRSIDAAAERLARLFDRILSHPDELPERFRRRVEPEGLARTVCDYVSGMTDRYVEELSEGSDR